MGDGLFQRITIRFDNEEDPKKTRIAAALAPTRRSYAPSGTTRRAVNATSQRGLISESLACDDTTPCGAAALSAVAYFAARIGCASALGIVALFYGFEAHRASLALWAQTPDEAAPCKKESTWLIVLAIAGCVEMFVECSFFVAANCIRTCCRRSQCLHSASFVYAAVQLAEIFYGFYVAWFGLRVFLGQLNLPSLAQFSAGEYPKINPKESGTLTSCSHTTINAGIALSMAAATGIAVNLVLRLAFSAFVACTPRKPWLCALVGAAPFRAVAGEFSDDAGGAFVPLRQQELPARR